jgi:hypothetical protein
MSIEFATAVAFQQSQPSRRPARAYAPALAKPVVSRAARMADFTDCVELTFGALVMVGVLLFAAGLLRFCSIDGQAAGAGLQFATRILYAAAGLAGGAALCGAGFGIHRLVRG